MELETPLSCDVDTSLQSKTDTSRGQEDMEGLDDEAPLKNSNRASSSLKSKRITCQLISFTPMCGVVLHCEDVCASKTKEARGGVCMGVGVEDGASVTSSGCCCDMIELTFLRD